MCVETLNSTAPKCGTTLGLTRETTRIICVCQLLMDHLDVRPEAEELSHENKGLVGPYIYRRNPGYVEPQNLDQTADY